ncbi:MAG: Acetate kinase [Verrucomicrobia subdivision 3 bacterium]|nr:Acetate kinase [Limisphaerales bacterium]MCS1414014.1 Acetate kinase [Limisphaerales bacterium]
MKILIANLGSTSLKYRLFDFSAEGDVLVTRGGFERVEDYQQAVDSCLEELKQGGHIESADELAAVGFKTVLADGVTGCVRLDDSVLKAMEAGNSMAPVHNPAYLTGVRVFSERMPGTPLVGLFETAFYQWIPETAKRYAVPASWYEAGVRRWGFHGASHKFVAERSATLLGREDVAERARRLYVDVGTMTQGPPLRVISCHLGGSSSVTGIRDGVAIGNSMGMSPQSGLPNNDRVGDMDAFAILHMMRMSGLTIDEVEWQLCKEAGLKGLSGGYSDFRDIQERAALGSESAQLALNFLGYETRRWIGSYYLELNGLDALVFTAGIGENRAEIRERVCMGLDQLGIELDAERNGSVLGTEGEISAPGSKTKIFVIPTNEELVVAREVKRFLEKN